LVSLLVLCAAYAYLILVIIHIADSTHSPGDPRLRQWRFRLCVAIALVAFCDALIGLGLTEASIQ